MLDKLDREYPIERFEKFFTSTYVALNGQSKRIQYSNAAHPPPVLIHPDETLEFLDKGGTIIGIGGALPFEGGENQLRADDKLFIYTDGIVEYQDEDGNFYGEDRLFDEMKRLKDEPVSRMIDGVIASAMDFGKNNEPQDDISLLGVEIR